jgi:hypothetical protein
MSKVSRRGFIAQTTASVATVGVLATMPMMALETETPQAASVASAATSEIAPALATMSEPVIAHVSDIATGEISLMVGTQEIVYRDPELVQRLLRAIPIR